MPKKTVDWQECNFVEIMNKEPEKFTFHVLVFLHANIS